jgi:hypothetical protein
MNIEIIDRVQNYIKSISSAAEKSQIVQYLARQEQLGHIVLRPVSALIGDGYTKLGLAHIAYCSFMIEMKL